MRRTAGVIVLLLPVLIAAALPSRRDGERLRAAGAAAVAGEVARAIALYEQAQRDTTDPGLVTYNLATLHQAQARAGSSAALAAAEAGYRCLLGPHEPRRARALYGLGNCLLLRGTTGQLDAPALRAAIDRYTECLRDPGCDAALADDARHNRERARLVLAQAPPPAAESGDPADGGDDRPKDQPPPTGTGGPKQPSPGGTEAVPDADGKTGPGQEKDGSGSTRPAAGKGTLAPVPSSPAAPPLSAREAGEHVERAAERILEDNRAHRRSRARGAVPGVRDW